MIDVIRGIEKGESIDEKLLLKNIAKKKGKNGHYLDMTFQDSKSDINGKVWDITSDINEFYRKVEVSTPHVVRVIGKANEYNNNIQLNIENIEVSVDEFEVSDFYQKAPVEVEEIIQKINNSINRIENEILNKIAANLFSKYKESFKSFPAAQKMHHAVHGGLAWHTYNVLYLCMCVKNLYGDLLNNDLLISGAVIHDIAKINEMKYENGVVTDYTDSGKLKGHIVMVSQEIREEAIKLDINPDCEEILLLEHLLLSHHGTKEWGSPVEPKIPEAIALASIDLLDSRMGGVYQLMQSTNEGEWSDWSKMFNSQIKKHNVT
jgi:3'-5' exoribonuclease